MRSHLARVTRPCSLSRANSCFRFSRPFHSLGLSPSIERVLDRFGYRTPTPIQQKGIPPILDGRDCVLAAETGSGKTLSYLTPVINLLWARHVEGNMVEDRRYPTVIVLVPNRDLCAQVTWVAQELLTALHKDQCGDTNPKPLVCRMAVGEEVFPPAGQNTDILVTTPLCLERNVFSKVLRDRAYATRNVRTLVVDEADDILAGHSKRLAFKLLRHMGRCSDGGRDNPYNFPVREGDVQMVFAAATLPTAGTKNIQDWLRLEFPTAAWAVTDELHQQKAGQNVTFLEVKKERDLVNLEAFSSRMDNDMDERSLQHLLSLSKDGDEGDGGPPLPSRDNTLLKVLTSHMNTHKRTLIFVNSVKIVEHVYSLLHGKRIVAEKFYKLTKPQERGELLRRFNEGELPVLVCTSAASRGIDFHHVSHVIQYEMANDVVDHLHRSGRASRMSVSQMDDDTDIQVTCLYSSKERDLVESIRTQGLENSFSRKRNFSKKNKRRERELNYRRTRKEESDEWY